MHDIEYYEDLSVSGTYYTISSWMFVK